MTTSLAKTTSSQRKHSPRVLVVDDEPGLQELVSDVTRGLHGQVIGATSLAQAKEILATQPIEVVVLDKHLPDGDGTSLLPVIRRRDPATSTIVVTGSPSAEDVINAMRQGAVDFLAKPFSADALRQRLGKAAAQQQLLAKSDRRLRRLRDAVTRLNDARRVVSKKVDLLCNDLISAYGELSRQFNETRTQQAFRLLLDEAADLEQLLCHAMDWMLRQFGYSNVAIWLASEDREFQLGAYMKYTIAGEPAFTQTMQKGILPLVLRQGLLHLSAEEVRRVLSPEELKHMSGQTVLAGNCTYLGETLAAIVLFRDGKIPFSDEHASLLRAISPIFAVAMASMVRGPRKSEADSDGGAPEDGSIDNHEPRKPRRRDEADWWKRGEQPPF